MQRQKPRVLLVIPAFNEEELLRDTIAKVQAECRKLATQFFIDVMVCDNNSTDATPEIAQEILGILYRREPLQGKGYAVMRAWMAHQYEYEIFAFLDADLATDLSALQRLLQSCTENSPIAIGTRYHEGAKLHRPLLRRTLSRLYRMCTRWLLGIRASDLPCGFKAVRACVVQGLVPKVRDGGWFFDSELIMRAERDGYTIVEVPVVWHEPRVGKNKSRMRLIKVLLAYAGAIRAMRADYNDKETDA